MILLYQGTKGNCQIQPQSILTRQKKIFQSVISRYTRAPRQKNENVHTFEATARAPEAPLLHLAICQNSLQLRDMVSFQRPKGAAADLRELEYVSALQQTQNGAVRKDGSIQDVDIQLFLKSRYGIEVSIEDVRRLLMGGFGDGDVIDLSELTAMLLIPTLVKAVSSKQESSVLYPEPGLIQNVLDMILRDVTGSSNPPKLTVSLLRELLLAYGEEEMSNDMGLLRDMMNVAGNEGDDFDVVAFSRALTSDIMLYNVENEVSLTTNYRDVMESTDPSEKTEELSVYKSTESDDEVYLLEKGRNSMNDTDKSDAPAKIRKFPSSPAIDFTACRYSSKYIVVFLWTGFVISYIAYFRRLIQLAIGSQLGNSCPNGKFGCRLAYAIVEWLFILATLCAFGLAYVAFSSIGNGIEETRKWTRCIAMFFIGFVTWFFFLVLYSRSDQVVGTTFELDENGNPINGQDIVYEKSQPYEAVVYFISLICGNVVIVLELYMIFGDTIRKRCMGRVSKSLMRFVTSSGIKAEAGNKRAGAEKINSLVDNARQIHSFSVKEIHHGQTFFGAGLLNFSICGEEFEDAGGFLWTWKGLYNKDLFCKEGIWISARLLAGNFAQLLISAFVLTYGIAFTRYVVEEWEKGLANPSRYLYLALEWLNVLVPVEEYAGASCAFATDIANDVLNSTAILLLSADNTTCSTLAGEAINRTMESISDSLYPQERYMVEVPMSVATAVAFVYTLALVVVYIPSVASTTLQFRSGAIPFFRDEYNFDVYRSRLDQVTILLGSMFWSALYAAAFAGTLVGVVVFLFLYQVCGFW